MKKHALLLATLFAICYTAARAQGNPTPSLSHNHEIGLQMTGVNFNGFMPFTAIYKKKVADNKFRRYRGTFTSINFNNQLRRSNFQVAIGGSIGSEKRKPVGKRTVFFHGPEFDLGVSFGKQEGFDPQWGLQPGFSYIIGVQYDLGEFWAINLEVSPGFSFNFHQFASGNEFYSSGIGFSNLAALAIMHKF